MPVESDVIIVQDWGVQMTVDKIVAATRLWSPEQIGELIGRLTNELHGIDPEIEAVWLAEVERRLEEIQTGRVQGIPLETSLYRVRKIAGL